MYVENNFVHLRICAEEKLCTVQKSEMVKSAFVFLCKVQKLHFKNNLRCRFAHFVHDGFSHICRFARFVFCACAEVCEHVEKCFLHLCAFVKTFCKSVRICEMCFFAFCTEFANLSVFCKKCQKVEISENVPKMSEKSSRVPEWYTSGSWANAFDNTGWQKSPEYALIRIAAGAPDLAKSGQIRPPDGPGRKKLPDLAPVPLLLPGLKSCPELFFPDTRTDLRSVDLFPRRVEFCDRVRHILQMCAHFAKHSLKTAVRAQRHSVHCAHRAQPKPTHVHKLCTPETQTCTLVHTSPQPSTHWQRTHRPCVALVGGRRRADASFIHEDIIIMKSIVF